jgi:hypothetical protein
MVASIETKRLGRVPRVLRLLIDAVNGWDRMMIVIIKDGD